MADIRKQSQGEERPQSDLQGKRVKAVFYRTEAGGEPVREWLKSLPSREDRKRIGEDVKTIEFGWPMGMPLRRRWYLRGTVGPGSKPHRSGAVLF
jgi:hypothetical protein